MSSCRKCSGVICQCCTTAQKTILDALECHTALLVHSIFATVEEASSLSSKNFTTGNLDFCGFDFLENERELVCLAFGIHRLQCA
jgi:hypothetical protein